MYYCLFQCSRAATILYRRKQTAEAMWGGLAKPAADCQNRPAATTRKAPGANGCRLRLAALRRRRSSRVARATGRPIANRPQVANLPHKIVAAREDWNE